MKLNELLADSNVLYVKIHNYHWNIKGPQFYGLHAKTEELYTYFSTLYDDLGERLLQIDGHPLLTLAQMLQITRIKEDEKRHFNAHDIFITLMADLKFILEEFKILSELCQEDVGTRNFADSQITFLEKEIWMMKSMLQ